MARKRKTVLYRLVSTDGTGSFYVQKKNPRTHPEKFRFKKYDPKLRKHVIFEEKTIK